MLNTTKYISIVTLGITLSSCVVRKDATENISQYTDGDVYGSMQVDVNKYASNKLVCDPFDDGVSVNPISYEHGIKASLHYLINDMPRMYKSSDYVTFGFKSTQSVFLRDVNVPTRMFTEGFVAADKSILKDDNNQKLIEYFGLKMNSNIMLTEMDEEGDYELALLSDDGTTLKIGSGESQEVLIDNDGDHPTRMGCAKKTVSLTRDTLLPIELSYYQGPRYHISNVMLYRKSSTAGKDASCGLTGNETFFNPNDNSKPTAKYSQLLERGWKVLTPRHFVLSKNSNGGGDYNPCVQGTMPVITEFSLSDVVIHAAYFVWYTDIPATAQLQLTNTKTGEVTTTQSDNQLRTQHYVSIAHLQPNTTYKVRAVSVSADLGRTMSKEEIELVIGSY